jgi:hypothetical protein
VTAAAATDVGTPRAGGPARRAFTGAALPYETVISGHGLPRGDGLPVGRGIYDANREYLAVAAKAFAEATGSADLNQRLEAAFPSYGGTAMQGLQNFYLYPGARA